PPRAAARVEEPARRRAGATRADLAGPDTVGSTALAPRRLPPEPDEVTDTGARRTRSTFHVATAADAAPAAERDAYDAYDDYDEDDSSLLLQWGIFVAQTLTGAAVGLGVWLGFFRLWSTWPLYAAPAVGVVMIAMLVGGRTLRRRHGHDLDLFTAVLAIGIGTVLTVLPAAFTLQGVA
ncbi:MAG: hypothetical protein AVDCRST_MAG41-2531, partial [uncultured Corynebacteriales bacterium]